MNIRLKNDVMLLVYDLSQEPITLQLTAQDLFTTNLRRFQHHHLFTWRRSFKNAVDILGNMLYVSVFPITCN